MEISPQEAFSAIYLSFLGKESGPQAGWLLASLEHEFVVTRLTEMVK
jgi:lysyl-tRNA synthetase class 1